MAQKKPKFVIQPFKHNIQMDSDYADKTWNTLKKAIHEIHKQNASGLSFEELYRNAYNMVLHKYGDKLYTGLRDTVTEHLQSIAEHIAAENDDSFMHVLNDKWKLHKISMMMIRDILMYMDRTYVTQFKKTNVYDLGLQIFRDQVARAPKIKDRLLNALLSLVHRERTTEIIDRSLFKGVTQMLVDLGREVYVNDFELPFLEASALFYQAESQQCMSQSSASEYMKKVQGALLLPSLAYFCVIRPRNAFKRKGSVLIIILIQALKLRFARLRRRR